MTLAFDLFDAAVQQRPFEAYADLRTHGAVRVADPMASPLTFVISQYDAVRQVLADPITFRRACARAPHHLDVAAHRPDRRGTMTLTVPARLHPRRVPL
jgi:cytochrome P450